MPVVRSADEDGHIGLSDHDRENAWHSTQPIFDHLLEAKPVVVSKNSALGKLSLLRMPLLPVTAILLFGNICRRRRLPWMQKRKVAATKPSLPYSNRDLTVNSTCSVSQHKQEVKASCDKPRGVRLIMPITAHPVMKLLTSGSSILLAVDNVHNRL